MNSITRIGNATLLKIFKYGIVIKNGSPFTLRGNLKARDFTPWGVVKHEKRSLFFKVEVTFPAEPLNLYTKKIESGFFQTDNGEERYQTGITYALWGITLGLVFLEPIYSLETTIFEAIVATKEIKSKGLPSHIIQILTMSHDLTFMNERDRSEEYIKIYRLTQHQELKIHEKFTAEEKKFSC